MLYPRLFATMQLGGLTLRNRVVHASMSTRLGQPGGVSPAYLRYCETRARGGAGMLITEPVGLLHEKGAARIPTASDDRLAELAIGIQRRTMARRSARLKSGLATISFTPRPPAHSGRAPPGHAANRTRQPYRRRSWPTPAGRQAPG